MEDFNLWRNCAGSSGSPQNGIQDLRSLPGMRGERADRPEPAPHAECPSTALPGRELTHVSGLDPPGRTLEVWSGREDLNLRPPGPEPGALPGCATPRQVTESAQTGKARNLACRQGRQTQYAEIIAPSVILFLSSPFVRVFVLAGTPVVRYSPPLRMLEIEPRSAETLLSSNKVRLYLRRIPVKLLAQAAMPQNHKKPLI
jgi:hypothetical protein